MPSSPTPVEVMNTPDPVAVQGLHIAWNTFDATIIAVGIAVVAAGLAGWALIVAINDANRNAQQFKDFMRRPNLEARHWADLSLQQHGTWCNAIVAISVLNNGQRLTRHFLVELLVPLTVFERPPSTDHSEVRRIGRTDYMVYQAIVNKPFFPTNVATEVHRFNFGTKPDVGRFAVLWRIYDDYGIYPRDNWGQWQLDAPRPEG